MTLMDSANLRQVFNASEDARSPVERYSTNAFLFWQHFNVERNAAVQLLPIYRLKFMTFTLDLDRITRL